MNSWSMYSQYTSEQASCQEEKQVVKRFYRRFRTEHSIFQTFIQGMASEMDRVAYTSLMLNRLMFLYFMQHKGFLNGDTDYVANHLRKFHQGDRKGPPHHSFYRYFLLPLFHERLGTQAHSSSPNLDFGKVPYLNCGLFNVHRLERDHPDIAIADEAFARLFAFFDAYRWQLDEGSLCAANEINPDILGSILEQYVNQKQMGAYYTKEDISEYITKNTIIPFLFNATEKKCPAAFEQDGPIWRLLRNNPDRYIYEAVRCEGYLPTETEREYATRRGRYAEIKARMLGGEVISINDLITYNLDIRRFAQDVIESCEERGLLRAFYESIERVTILDPTCGSGAFLLAALKVLEPLYEVCLDQQASHETERFGNRRYSIRKSIILNNLYGVDMMEEATEICKLRLFLELIAQVEHREDLEPLPIIDSNIRTGNTLVGFSTADEVSGSMGYTPHPTGAKELKRAPQAPLRAPTDLPSLRSALRTIRQQDQHLMRTQLDHLLAGRYGIDLDNTMAFEHWRSSYQPFHWCVEFDEIMQRGGFDVIIGNPPYAEYNEDTYTLPPGMYETELCGNLYGFCMERFAALGNPISTSGLIVPLSIVCTSRMAAMRRILYSAYSHLWFNNYDTIPGTLFSGIVQRNSIVLTSRGTGRSGNSIYTTRNQKWYAPERASLFESVPYLHICPQSADELVPKVSCQIELTILSKIHAQRCPITSYIQRHSDNTLSYKRRWSYFLLFADTIEGIVLPDGSTRQQQDVKTLALQPQLDRYVFIALLSSSLFYFHYSVFSDFRHVNRADFDRFTFDYTKITEVVAHRLSMLGKTLMQSYRDNLEWRTCDYIGSIGECRVPFYRQGTSKPIIDEIDMVLAGHYGLTDEELDFITNYEIKYRIGRDNGEEDEGR